MARITKPLTNTEVKQAKPKEKVYTLSDGGGLQLRVKPNGSKLWLFDYFRPFTKVRTSLSFGSYADVSIADARKKRDEARELLAKEIDPKDHRDETSRQNEAAHSNTLRHIATQWLEVKKSKVSDNHALDTWRSLEGHILPRLGEVPIHKITAIKTIEVIKPIAAKGALETVKRLCQRLNEIMIFAVNTGLITANPLSGIQKAFQSPVKKHLPTLKPSELPTLLATLTMASIKLTTRCLIEWQLHTMVRPGEAAGARWDEIDYNKKSWSIPAERMKKKKPHNVPLSPQSIALLELMKPISSRSEFIFPSDRNFRTHTNAQTANTALKRMGFDKQLVAHGLRALASTTLNEQGFEADIIEAALAHVGDNEVRSAYNRATYIQRRIPMMNWWSEHIEKAATGNMSLAGRMQALTDDKNKSNETSVSELKEDKPTSKMAEKISSDLDRKNVSYLEPYGEDILFLTDRHKSIVNDVVSCLKSNSPFCFLGSESGSYHEYYKEIIIDHIKIKEQIELLYFDPKFGDDLSVIINKELKNVDISLIGALSSSISRKILIIDNENFANNLDWELFDSLRLELKVVNIGVFCITPSVLDDKVKSTSTVSNFKAFYLPAIKKRELKELNEYVAKHSYKTKHLETLSSLFMKGSGKDLSDRKPASEESAGFWHKFREYITRK